MGELGCPLHSMVQLVQIPNVTQQCQETVSSHGVKFPFWTQKLPRLKILHHNFAKLCRLPPWWILEVEISHFQKSKLVDGCHLKNQLNVISPNRSRCHSNILHGYMQRFVYTIRCRHQDLILSSLVAKCTLRHCWLRIRHLVKSPHYQVPKMSVATNIGKQLTRPTTL